MQQKSFRWDGGTSRYQLKALFLTMTFWKLLVLINQLSRKAYCLCTLYYTVHDVFSLGLGPLIHLYKHSVHLKQVSVMWTETVSLKFSGVDIHSYLGSILPERIHLTDYILHTANPQLSLLQLFSLAFNSSLGSEYI